MSIDASVPVCGTGAGFDRDGDGDDGGDNGGEEESEDNERTSSRLIFAPAMRAAREPESEAASPAFHRGVNVAGRRNYSGFCSGFDPKRGWCVWTGDNFAGKVECSDAGKEGVRG